MIILVGLLLQDFLLTQLVTGTASLLVVAANLDAILAPIVGGVLAAIVAKNLLDTEEYKIGPRGTNFYGFKDRHDLKFMRASCFLML